MKRETEEVPQEKRAYYKSSTADKRVDRGVWRVAMAGRSSNLRRYRKEIGDGLVVIDWGRL